MNTKLGLLSESIAYFVVGALAILVSVHAGIPFLARQFGIAPVFGWFLTSGLLVTCFFFAAIIAARRSSGTRSTTDTLRALNLHRPKARDLVWALGGLLAVVVLTGVVGGAFSLLFSIDLLSRESYSSFLQIGKLQRDQYWIFLVWLPYFFFNIAGEELLWRGYLLPRQERAMGSKAWLVNGLLWAMVHSSLGLRMAAILLPIEFVVPYVVQRRRNTWLGIIIHGIYNGSGFILVALGLGT